MVGFYLREFPEENVHNLVRPVTPEEPKKKRWASLLKVNFIYEDISLLLFFTNKSYGNGRYYIIINSLFRFC